MQMHEKLVSYLLLKCNLLLSIIARTPPSCDIGSG